jgi:hypothetical protein
MLIWEHSVGIFWTAILSVPFCCLWNRLAPVYFNFLDGNHLHLPYKHCLGLFLMGWIVRSVMLPTPRIIVKRKWL